MAQARLLPAYVLRVDYSSQRLRYRLLGHYRETLRSANLRTDRGFLPVKSPAVPERLVQRLRHTGSVRRSRQEIRGQGLHGSEVRSLWRFIRLYRKTRPQPRPVTRESSPRSNTGQDRSIDRTPWEIQSHLSNYGGKDAGRVLSPLRRRANTS